MKVSERLQQRIDELMARHDFLLNEIRANGGYGSDMSLKYTSELMYLDTRIRRLQNQTKIEKCYELDVGDGCTYYLGSDAFACTVVKRTPGTIWFQEDEAILDPNFHPEFDVGGFCGHCTNQEDQTYVYKRNPKSRVLQAKWSKVWNCFMYQGRRVTVGRHQFYDYNF